MSETSIVREYVAVATLSNLALGMFGDLVNAVVDIERSVMAIGGEMHADEEALLLEDGSRQADIWGISLYPTQDGSADFVGFDSMINIRHGQGDRTRGVDDPETRTSILDAVDRPVRS